MTKTAHQKDPFVNAVYTVLIPTLESIAQSPCLFALLGEPESCEQGCPGYRARAALERWKEMNETLNFKDYGQRISDLKALVPDLLLFADRYDPTLDSRVDTRIGEHRKLLAERDAAVERAKQLISQG